LLPLSLWLIALLLGLLLVGWRLSLTLLSGLLWLLSPGFRRFCRLPADDRRYLSGGIG
jgi:hypothetical protein